jgi:hypothetical protein
MKRRHYPDGSIKKRQRTDKKEGVLYTHILLFPDMLLEIVQWLGQCAFQLAATNKMLRPRVFGVITAFPLAMPQWAIRKTLLQWKMSALSALTIEVRMRPELLPAIDACGALRELTLVYSDSNTDSCVSLVDSLLNRLGRLTALKIRHVRVAPDLSALTRLERLVLVGTRGIGLSHITSLTTLKRLSIFSIACPPTSPPLSSLSALPKLEALQLWTPSTFSTDVMKGLASLTTLTDLRVESRVPCFDARQLSTLTNLRIFYHDQLVLPDLPPLPKLQVAAYTGFGTPQCAIGEITRAWSQFPRLNYVYLACVKAQAFERTRDGIRPINCFEFLDRVHLHPEWDA